MSDDIGHNTAERMHNFLRNSTPLKFAFAKIDGNGRAQHVSHKYVGLLFASDILDLDARFDLTSYFIEELADYIL